MTRHRAVGPSTPKYPQPAVRVAAYTRVVVLNRRRPSNLERRQARLTAFIAAQPGWHVVVGYGDVGSGRPDRPGLARLLADAPAGWFGLLVVDDLERLSRDPRQLAWIGRQLSTAGVRVLPLAASPRRRCAAALTSLVISDYLCS